jgi:hypothetical protein
VVKKALSNVRFGSKATLKRLHPMSALPPKADIGTHSSDVCFVPKADIVVCRHRLETAPHNLCGMPQAFVSYSELGCDRIITVKWQFDFVQSES